MGNRRQVGMRKKARTNEADLSTMKGNGQTSTLEGTTRADFPLPPSYF